MKQKTTVEEYDIVLIGAGVMSSTLGAILKQLQPNLKIRIFERLEFAGLESSDALNNAGTGHSAFCELNYTPENPDGSIDTKKAFKINEEFNQSKQFWSYLVHSGFIDSKFINRVPHMSFVSGKENVAFLKKRYEALSKSHLFEDMKYTEDLNQIKKWTPLMTEKRDSKIPVAMTRVERGTDIDFGLLTNELISYLTANGVEVNFNHEVSNLYKKGNFWNVTVKDIEGDKKIKVKTKFIFIGAGGLALYLLEKSGIKEAKGYGGFPVSGRWLVCNDQKIVSKHSAKVYGKAFAGAPPMSVPHLDTRMINGEKSLLFGPYAGFSTKFLKNGSYMDLPNSIKSDNIMTMLSAGVNNISLTKYLVNEVFKSDEERFKALVEFYPTANPKDWKVCVAGQRVQVIKKGKNGKGVLEFGTEIVNSEDGTIAALLGASPGASTSVSIMLELIEKCFYNKVDFKVWEEKLKVMIPSYKKSLKEDKYLFYNIETKTSSILNLNI